MLNWNFIKLLKWVWDFEKRYPQKIGELLNIYSSEKEVYILKSYKEIDGLIENLHKF